MAYAAKNKNFRKVSNLSKYGNKQTFKEEEKVKYLSY